MKKQFFVCISAKNQPQKNYAYFFDFFMIFFRKSGFLDIKINKNVSKIDIFHKKFVHRKTN